MKLINIDIKNDHTKRPLTENEPNICSIYFLYIEHNALLQKDVGGDIFCNYSYVMNVRKGKGD